MPELLLVTGSDHKLAEWQRLVPADYELGRISIDLDEIQSLDSKEIIADKVKRAYALAQKPVLVEDVTAGLDKLNGLPGPFIKFFEQRLGKDALYQLAGQQEAAAVITCTIGYYDGTQLIFASGEVRGKVVSARGNLGFGFDYVFMPEGQTQTFAEMTRDQKDTISHRALAIKDLLAQLKEL